jgi:hypothetical protein
MKPQTKKQVKEMIKAGYPLCLSKGDWGGKYPRHCDACIEVYNNSVTTDKNVV